MRTTCELNDLPKTSEEKLDGLIQASVKQPTPPCGLDGTASNSVVVCEQYVWHLASPRRSRVRSIEPLTAGKEK